MYNIETITNAVAQMNMEEKQVLFHLVSAHAELFNKIVPGLPLVIHALGQETLKHPLAEQYDAWLNAKTAAASAG